MNNKLIPISLALATILAVWACNKEKMFTTDPGVKLEFSLDTLRFDTVFTELGSATRLLKVYNRHDKSVKISRIRVGKGDQSNFRINVDGIPGNEVRDVVIFPHDSIYVFGEVTVDPDQPLSVSPFVITDEIIFELNGNEQSVTLEAWGQNANYFPNRWFKNGEASFSCNGGEIVWDDPKPYVIYGRIEIRDCNLRIPAGARIHVHGGLGKQEFDMDSVRIFNTGLLAIHPSASLLVEGTQDNPVIFQGDRLEEEFQDADGQWFGIYLEQGSRGNRFEYAIIKNPLFGIFADSAAELTLKNTQILNASGSGLIGIHSDITAENCLFADNGNRAVQIGFGGTYDFTYCTLASFGVDAPALSLSNGICDDPLCSTGRVFPLNALFRNCIIYGSRRDEISLSDFTGGEEPNTFNYNLKNCIVRVKDLVNPDEFPDFFDFCDPCINATPDSTLFVAPNEDDYRLDTLSIAEGRAVPVFGIFTDLVGTLRDADHPDIGCYEYVPE
ncbi:MAG: right-handed parallel beta-helix repeat-containing protein [Bacteroidetes bacterium]|nr:MAG: right-handed parallel beta-helix repeat-containing protein [Bacteroidota bacterium]